MRRWLSLCCLALAALGLIAAADDRGVADLRAPQAGDIVLIRVDGVINAASSAHIADGLANAQETGAALVLLELDTPGGLVTDTKDIIQEILNATVPVVVYVSPRGAWAGSAGTFITMAGHVAAMAPGTTIGAAHPVGPGPNPRPADDEDGNPQHSDYGMEKAENLLASYIESVAKERGRNIEWAAKAVRESVAATAEEAVELDVVDFIAEDRDDLLAKLEGRKLDINGEEVEIAIADAHVREVQMDRLGRLFQALADPNVIAILGLLGMAGLYVEFNSPGLIAPGLLGVLALVLAALGTQQLPFDWTGFVLIGIGVAFVIAEAFVPTYGLMLAIGLGLMLYGGSLTFDRPEVSDLNIDFWSVLVPAIAGFGLCAAAVVLSLRKLPGLAQQSGIHELIGQIGVASTPLDPSGTVFIRGEYWKAVSEGPVEADERVETLSVDGLELRVRKVTDA